MQKRHNKVKQELIEFVLTLMMLIFIVSYGLYFAKKLPMKCTEYKEIPYRYVKGFFAMRKVETREGNQDIYLKRCVRGINAFEEEINLEL